MFRIKDHIDSRYHTEYVMFLEHHFTWVDVTDTTVMSLFDVVEK